MKVSVVRLWNEGKQVPRWQLSTLKPVVGELRIQESRDDHLNRFMRSAHLFDFSQRGHPDALPPLVDAAVLYIKGSTMSISGFERGDMGPTYAQTWLIEVLSTSHE
ncbi:MAG TPA: hypothetical protein VEC35_01450 [Noviherbaspirillum sp.]|nr:hypothetical protein [Noviherbaspirillum sp.]